MAVCGREGEWSCGAGGIFFFQAEDGIRDLVRSRGLGDVYKRQVYGSVDSHVDAAASDDPCWLALAEEIGSAPASAAVSYTHLTLPTSDLVEISVVAVSFKKKKE